jgi:hypothetical protein
MLRNTPNEDEAAIVVAIRRGKAPCTTSALNGQRQEYPMLAGDAVEQRIYKRDLLPIHLGRNASQTHLSNSGAGYDLSAEAERYRQPETADGYSQSAQGRLPCPAMTKKIP